MHTIYSPNDYVFSNLWLRCWLLKTAASTDTEPYHYHPRHHTNDPEYGFSGPRVKTFKKGFPAPDVHFWRAQGDAVPPARGNFPDWDPDAAA